MLWLLYIEIHNSLVFFLLLYIIVIMERIQTNYILKDLNKKIVLLFGPRQTGKTWLAKSLSQHFENTVYLNYDNYHDKKIIEKQMWLDSTDLLILDELHKMPLWKNYLKGLYDTKPPQMHILVTGSARLDAYDKMGDSLAGRYFRHRLLPLSLAELSQINAPLDLDLLLTRGGFPEAYLADNNTEADRWRLQYTNSILSTDVFEFDQIHNFKAMKLVFDLLRNRVGSHISYRSLANDVAISPITIKKYIQILEALYVVFTVTPYSKNIARSILKEPKIYFFDNGLVQGDTGSKLENLIAVSLLKELYAKVDYQAKNYNLHYLRTKDGEEIDFAISLNHQIEKIIEVKLFDPKISKTLLKFSNKYNYPAIQVVKSLKHEYKLNNITVLTAENFLKNLFI